MTQEILEEILGELRAQRVPKLWRTDEIGIYFNVSSKAACRIVADPTFPDPVDAPGVRRVRLPSEVQEWATKHRKRKGSSGG